MLIKIKESYRYIVAVCDTELLGKYFEEDEFQLDIKKSFYEGEEKNKEEAIQIMKEMKKEDATFNIVGKKSTQAALEAGIINEKGIKTINDIPFALVLL
ncbi:DUF424 family protein [Candidatus Pacearchaeota archaeon]|nr:DUF424 family protein [Candidatus Pacearchaeota archaeon]